MGSILTLRHYSHDLIAHSHEHAQLVFGLSGQLDFEVEGHGSLVQQQSFVVVPAGARHVCGSPGGSRCLVLDIPGEQWVGQHLGEHAQASRRLLDNAQRRVLAPNQSRLVNWLADCPVDDPLIAQQGAVLLLASLNQAGDGLPGQRRLPYSALNAHIDRHAAYPLQVADLARIAGLSGARLHARFIAECGRSPMDYVRQRRLQMALELLRGSTLPIGEIASRVGYSSQSAFGAAILREFGHSPRQLRQGAHASSTTKHARITTDDAIGSTVD
ncbi:MULTISPECIES: AraC family transcriptional regulator [Pseudomonas]|uniref:AraC family transcriptional regulator n=1 Tax=Pseudomonas sessilinigenes TaxID=658629 RepID=A0ABX8MTP4_9PSED|nr:MULTISPECIES: AraC family transcriptional regulator [Pseudomonas]AZC23342.1 Transcriptional regulator, AraC family [Pseudomonas sessilinigenes]QXH42347.1 AraC family transcriptional regulator [Pseudomonas sessilinigenes]UMZ13644.1 helix-turn-helix domain-containing protein [Pseudomonas sp. MPFS]